LYDSDVSELLKKCDGCAMSSVVQRQLQGG